MQGNAGDGGNARDAGMEARQQLGPAQHPFLPFPV